MHFSGALPVDRAAKSGSEDLRIKANELFVTVAPSKAGQFEHGFACCLLGFFVHHV